MEEVNVSEEASLADSSEFLEENEEVNGEEEGILIDLPDESAESLGVRGSDGVEQEELQPEEDRGESETWATESRQLSADTEDGIRVRASSVRQFEGEIFGEELQEEEVGDRDYAWAEERGFDIDEATREGLVPEGGRFDVTKKVIQVKIESLQGIRYVNVTIESLLNGKLYCGGFRDTRSGLVYYHTFCQTDSLRESREAATGARSDTKQTQVLLPLVDEAVNTAFDKMTQAGSCNTGGVYIPTLSDRIVTSRPYVPHDTARKTRIPLDAVLVIQRAWRAYIEKKRIRERYQALMDVRTAETDYTGSSLQEFRKHQLKQLTKHSYPLTRGDFYDLYAALGEWKKKQLTELHENKMGFALKAAAIDLQNEGTKGVLAIETYRTRAQRENSHLKDVSFLERAAKGKVRRYAKGNVTIIDDLQAQRARKMKDMLTSYTRTDVTATLRVEILLSLKSCLADFEAVDLTYGLIELLNREIDFLAMGVDTSKIVFLRKRFESLFIDFVKSQEKRAPAKRKEKKFPVYRCQGCKKVFSPTRMFVHLRMGRFRLCAACNYLHITSTASTNLTPYERMLTALREEEQEKCCRSAIPFLLQPWGMYFLVHVLWDSKSVISESSYLPGLKVTRWLPNEEWSMWNMILLTELEAYQHEKLTDPVAHYTAEFVRNVTVRNIWGRMHFAIVADIDAKFWRSRRGVEIDKMAELSRKSK